MFGHEERHARRETIRGRAVLRGERKVLSGVVNFTFTTVIDVSTREPVPHCGRTTILVDFRTEEPLMLKITARAAQLKADIVATSSWSGVGGFF